MGARSDRVRSEGGQGTKPPRLQPGQVPAVAEMAEMAGHDAAFRHDAAGDVDMTDAPLSSHDASAGDQASADGNAVPDGGVVYDDSGDIQMRGVPWGAWDRHTAPEDQLAGDSNRPIGAVADEGADGDRSSDDHNQDAPTASLDQMQWSASGQHTRDGMTHVLVSREQVSASDLKSETDSKLGANKDWDPKPDKQPSYLNSNTNSDPNQAATSEVGQAASSDLNQATTSKLNPDTKKVKTASATSSRNASGKPETEQGKKGKSAAVGGRKRGVGGAKKPSKRSKTGKGKGKKAQQLATAGTGETGVTGVTGETAATEEASDSDIDPGPYCLCRGPDDHRWMIMCDVCNDWFHGECIGLDKEEGEKLIDRFVCPLCKSEDNYTRYRKTCSLDRCTNAARLSAPDAKDRSVFCCKEHCDQWWAAMLAKLPSRDASAKAVQTLTREDFMGLLAATTYGEWNLGEQPFGNMDAFRLGPQPVPADASTSASSASTSTLLSQEEQEILQQSAAERLALGSEIVQYRKMMDLLDWASDRRQAAIEHGRFTKDSCGYDDRLDTVSVRYQFMAWCDTADGVAAFTNRNLAAPIGPGPEQEWDETRGMCDKKRCKPHSNWYKILGGSVRVLFKEAATTAAKKLERESVIRHQAEVRYHRGLLERNSVLVHD